MEKRNTFVHEQFKKTPSKKSEELNFRKLLMNYLFMFNGLKDS